MDKPSDKVILATGAHPDDIDISCAGTLAKWAKEGATIYYLVITDGSKGSEDHKIPNSELINTRQEEQRNAANIVGVKKVYFLDYIDGELENTHSVKKEVVKIIRQTKPTTVICFDPTFYYDETRQFVNHPDHRIAGEIILDCVYPFARNARTYSEFMELGLEPHVVEELLMINFSKSNFYVDITQTIDQKITALACHKSQFRDMDAFAIRVKEMAKLAGQKSKPKIKFAESFVRVTLRQPS